MISLSNLISEKFELPPALQKQLENTAYSAIGYIVSPQIEKFRKKLFSNKELNEKSYQGLKNIFGAIRMMTKGGGGNTKLTYKDVMVPEYFSATDSKRVMRKVSITIEKSGDDIYIETDEKRDSVFPKMVISKDYAGWDLKRLNEEWHNFEDSFQKWKKEFDRHLVITEQLKKKLESWKTLDKPKKPKIHPDNQKMVLVYEKSFDWDGKPRYYDHYFRVLPSYKSETYRSPNHFMGVFRPYIVQTIYLDQFNPDTYSVDYFYDDAYKVASTARHEGRHVIQHYGRISKNLKGDIYGGPPRTLTHPYNTDVRGIDPRGSANPISKHREVGDEFGRVLHPHRDVEFKTNLYDYKDDIEKFLSKNLPKNRWKEGFGDLIKYITGIYNYGGFSKKYPRAYSWESSITKKNLNELYKNDRPKFNQYVRELYKLIFNQ